MLRRALVLVCLAAGCERGEGSTDWRASLPDGPVALPAPGAGDLPGDDQGGGTVTWTGAGDDGCVGGEGETIQGAIDAAPDGAIVVICPGTWREHLAISGKRLTLRSRDGAETTIVDAEGNGRALAVGVGADVVVEGLTLRNGFTEDTGGNVSCTKATFALRDSAIEDGAAEEGGGVGARDCAGAIERTTFLHNRAEKQGGGVYAEPGLDLADSGFVENSALEGGGAYFKGSENTIVGNVFSGNLAEDDGGGLFVFRGAPRIDGNTFSENESNEEGGGLRLRSAGGVITNNLLVGNQADWRGGGAKISHDEVEMSGNEFRGNSSWGTGGALLLFESASLLRNETYVGNVADKGGAVAVLEGWDGVVFEDSTFEGNEAREDGAHLYVDLPRHVTTLRRVDLRRGQAERGGALFATSDSAREDGDPYVTSIRVENALFEANVASEDGGAAYLDEVEGELTNALFVGNDAREGAGMLIEHGRSDLSVTNTILAANTGGAAVDVKSGQDPTLRFDDFAANDRDLEGVRDVRARDGNRTVFPGFVDGANGDYHLAPGSPLVNGGDPALADPDGTRSDIGLYGGPEAAPF